MQPDLRSMTRLESQNEQKSGRQAPAWETDEDSDWPQLLEKVQIPDLEGALDNSRPSADRFLSKYGK